MGQVKTMYVSVGSHIKNDWQSLGSPRKCPGTDVKITFSLRGYMAVRVRPALDKLPDVVDSWVSPAAIECYIVLSDQDTEQLKKGEIDSPLTERFRSKLHDLIERG